MNHSSFARSFILYGCRNYPDLVNIMESNPYTSKEIYEDPFNLFDSKSNLVWQYINTPDKLSEGVRKIIKLHSDTLHILFANNVKNAKTTSTEVLVVEFNNPDISHRLNFDDFICYNFDMFDQYLRNNMKEWKYFYFLFKKLSVYPKLEGGKIFQRSYATYS
jgi:hypothetical protein